jgi:hypothetical protein
VQPLLARDLTLVLLLAACTEDPTDSGRLRASEGSSADASSEQAAVGADAVGDSDSPSLLDWLGSLGPQTRPTTQEDLDRINAARGDRGEVDPNAMALPEACGNPNPPSGPNPTYHVTLESLCEAMSGYGIPCPASRTELLTRLGTRCSEGTFTPQLGRGCGWDFVGENTPDGSRVVWRFDAASGALLAVTFEPKGAFACEPGRYAVTPDVYCNDPMVCSLCYGGSERNAHCPAEVLAVLPSSDCVAPQSNAPGCGQCTEEGSSPQHPEDGTLCTSPDACEPCSGLFFTSTCTCFQDGLSRWQTATFE